MQSVKHHILSLMMFTLLCLAAGAFALESIDCIDYSGKPDVRCKYYRIWDNRGAILYVVPPEADLIKKNAIKGASFFIYAPQEKDYGRDTLTLELSEDSSVVHNMEPVKADEGSGLVKLRVGSRY